MKLQLYRKAGLLVVICGAVGWLLASGINQQAQSTVQMPDRTGHINDFAHAIDGAKRQELENTLANLKQKTGIQFDVAIVETTGGQDIFDFSQGLAQSWKVAGRNSTGKSLLLVLSINEKTSFTQFSRAAQRSLPEGVLGEMSQRLRGYLSSDRTAEGVIAAIEYFANSVAPTQGPAVEDSNGPVAAATTSPITTEAERKPIDAPSPQVSPAAVAATPRDTTTAQLFLKPRAGANSAKDEGEVEEVELTLTLPVEARVTALKKFLEAHPDSSAKSRALELLISAHAALGDERLKKGDSAGGVEQLLLAISEAPAVPSDKLFAGVISQIPMNLYLRGERAAADTAARNIAAKFGADPKRLLSVAGFYIAVERGEEARQIAVQATNLAPDIAEAHQMLGIALHVSLRLEDAAAEYKRALELDPNLKGVRRRLADLRRAFGKNEEALTLYREQLVADASDKGARAGVVISLLNLGRIDEAKTELESGLKADPKNLPLLSSAAYWFAAHNENELALSLGNQAIELEPRYTWSHVAVARALIAQRNPLAAERVIRFARQYGKFPTLDYELANALVSAGLYEEAAEVLTQTFRLNNSLIETRLGGRTTAQAANFIELLARERQASIFQLAPAESEGNAKILKDLLVLATVTNSPPETINEQAAVAAAKEFGSGTDASRAHRELYAANKLLQKRIGFQAAYELSEAARASADAALTVPAVTLAVQADEYRDIRARAIAAGGTPDIEEAPANVLSNILRGRIEDTSGWARFNADKLDEAVDHLSRAVNILPAGTPASRTSLWHLGAALERQGKNEEAISYYIKSYNAGEPDPLRRGVIEKLYRRVNGSLAGLDERIGRASADVGEVNPARDETSPTKPAVTPETATSDTQPTAAPSSPSPEALAATPSPEVKQESQPSSTPTSEIVPAPSPTPAAESTGPGRERRVKTPANSPATFTVTGSVRDAGDNPLANVIVVLISSQGTVLTSTTNELGNYSFTVAPSDAGYRIIPSRVGFTFSPVDKLLPVVSGDLKDVNFIGTPSPKP
ncbi:MAG: TPM domain-containing protein [Pyrinomonadaceae bacterium]